MKRSGAFRVLGGGRFLQLIERNGWELVDRPGIDAVVAIVAVTPDDEIVLIEQYREPVRQSVLELPAGIVGDDGEEGESLDAAARRELEEETGYRAERLELLTIGPPSPGQSSEVVSILLALDVERVSGGGGVGDEEIGCHLVPRVSAASWLSERQSEGRLIDPKIWVGLYFLGARS